MQNIFKDFKPLNLKEKFAGVRLPKIKIDEKYYQELGVSSDISNTEFLKRLCSKRFNEYIKQEKIDISKIDEYKKRAAYEIKVLDELNFVDYILMVWDVSRFCDENGILRGAGRGSSAGSLLCYLTNITSIDPIKYNLLFERFISASRAKSEIINGQLYLTGAVPDIDGDYEYLNRYKVIEYLSKRYPNKTAKIVNISTLTGKNLIKECGKSVADKSEEEMNYVSGLIPQVFGTVQDIEDVYNEGGAFRKWCDNNKEVYEIALKLRGLVKNKSVHASGVVISPDEITNLCPVELTKDGDLISSFDMNDVGSICVKLDVLGLKTLTVIDDVCKIIKKKPQEINPIHPSSFALLQDFDKGYGIFQLEAGTAEKVTKLIKPKSLEEVSAVLALGRPGAMNFVSKYVEYKNRGYGDIIHPLFEDILKDTYQIPIYQEQLMQMVNKIGFSLEESYGTIKCINKNTLFVSKTRGWISVKDLLQTGFKDDLFLVMDETGKQSWGKIKDIWSNGNKRVVRTTCRNGLYIDTTSNHKILTNHGWKLQKYLDQENDFIVTSRKIDFDGQDVIPLDLIIILAGMVTEGFFTRKTVAHFTNFDKNILKLFINSFEKVFGFTPKHDEKRVYIHKQQKEALHKYMNYGLSKDKELPKELMGLTKETTRKLISFIWSCEGTVLKDGHLEICSKSRKLMFQVKLLLLRFDIDANFIEKVNKDYGTFYYLSIGQYSEILKFKNLFCDYLNKVKINTLNYIISRKKMEFNTVNIIPNNISKKMFWEFGLMGGHPIWWSSDISRSNFNKLAANTKDKYWMDFSRGNQSYIKIKSKSLHSPSEEVFDFSMEDESKPYIIANGIVIHNCIGKKLVDEVKEWEDKIKNKVRENKFPEDVGEIIWETLNASASYSFNASHSASYSYISLLTAYLKANYPLEFLFSCLKMAKHETNRDECIFRIANELRQYGYKLLPPSLKYSKDDYSLEKDGIRFGLLSIKGIKDSSIKKLKELSFDYKNKFEFFESAKQAKINIGVFSALIQAGAAECDFGESRSKLVLEAQTWNLLTEKEKVYCLSNGDKYNYNLLFMIKDIDNWVGDDGKKISRATRLNTIRKKYEPYKQIYLQNSQYEDFANWTYEKKLLGISYSKSLKEIFLPSCPQLISIEEFNNIDNNKARATIVGMVIEKIDGKSQKNGKVYTKFIVEDGTGLLSAFIFDGKMNGKEDRRSILEARGRIPKEGDIAAFRGTKFNDIFILDDISIQTEKIFTKLADIKEKSVES